MPRPTVLVATTDPVMAYALRKALSDHCRKYGLRLDICPGGSVQSGTNNIDTPAYDSAEELFDYLESRSGKDALSLADTLVILDVGVELEDAFESKAIPSGGWHVTDNRSGVALELILRFPQVFPVILSPGVPVLDAEKEGDVIRPCCPDADEEQWKGFCRLRNELCTRNKEEGSTTDFDPEQCVGMYVPLHFVSPLDKGAGLKSTLTRFACGMRSWFDPTGLRTLVRNRFLGTLFGSKSNWKETKDPREALSMRLGRSAVAVDEEREFAMFNAYAAYKFGYRAWLVTTWGEFDKHPLWTKGDIPQPGEVVVLRDIDLRFPDLPEKENEEGRLRGRLQSVFNEEWDSKLGDNWRVRVISSYKQVGKDDFRWCPEQKRLGEWDREDGYLGLSKPLSTIYKVKELCSDKRLDSVNASIRPVSSDNTDTISGHGAPYLNLAMAESLLRQSTLTQDEPVACLVGAMLAGEAYALLLGMSKTTALEALLLMHENEVAAEVKFPGISSKVQIKERKGDIEDTIKKLYRETGDPEAMNQFLSQFWAVMRIRYRKGEQFTAAEQSNKESLIAGVWSPKWLADRKFYQIIMEFGGIIVGGLKRCLVTVSTSLLWWFIVSFALLVIFTSIYAFQLDYKLSFTRSGVWVYLQLMFDTLVTSITFEPADKIKVIHDKGWGLFVMTFHIILSYILYGMFIAMLYRKVTRG
jgi:hypothetical protein